MTKEISYTLIAFVAIFSIHAGYVILKAYNIAQKWAAIDEVSLLSAYIEGQDYFLSFSYALAASFTLYAFLRFNENRKRGAVSVAGGITLIGLLYFGVCFILGCCGSPMLAVYIALFGSSFLGFTKPLIALVTLASVIISYFWLEKKNVARLDKVNS
ncbi:MAG: hypothetical protein ABIG42_06295 [bacterium]